MKELKCKVLNENGFHARPVAELVGIVSKYHSAATICKEGKKANLKSILGLLSLGIAKNDDVLIQIEGDDETQALAAIENLGKKSELW
jgi:phosphocarrier protein HPr